VTTSVLAFIPSPSQGVWHLGPIPIRAYALCIIAGIIAALVIGDRRWAARGGERGVIYDIALWAVPFGLIGGRLYHVMTDWTTYFGSDGKGFLAALRIWDGGLGIWGAVALGGVGAWLGCRSRGIPLPAFGDAIAPGIILAQAIGRLGNYFNQELYGRATDLPWGLEIYERRNAAGQTDMLNGVSTGTMLLDHPVHPTFLYELLWNLLIFGMLLWADRRFNLGHGRLFALYIAGYCVGRFWVELMRDDYATHFAGIRINTFTSMFVFIGAVIYIMVAPKGREDPATLRGNEPDESWVDELAALEATAGVVAAAKVAGEEDREEDKAESAATATAEPDVGDAQAVAAADVSEPEKDAEPVAAEDEAVSEGETSAEESVDTADESEVAAEAAEEPAAEAEAVEAAEADGAVEAAAEPVAAEDDVVSEGETSAEESVDAADESEVAVEAAEEPAAEEPVAAEDEVVSEAETSAEESVDSADESEVIVEAAEEPEAEGADAAEADDVEVVEADAEPVAPEDEVVSETDTPAEESADTADESEVAVEAAEEPAADGDEAAEGEAPVEESADSADESGVAVEAAEEPAAEAEAVEAAEADGAVEADAESVAAEDEAVSEGEAPAGESADAADEPDAPAVEAAEEPAVDVEVAHVADQRAATEAPARWWKRRQKS
jgi:prolipoprotein diacylglyceryl transferase